ncbi:hypothetical protein PO124_25545 [Bacillus licheniformis]|nr:hypothetical protein [Bacillus licheniformis]
MPAAGQDAEHVKSIQIVGRYIVGIPIPFAIALSLWIEHEGLGDDINDMSARGHMLEPDVDFLGRMSGNDEWKGLRGPVISFKEDGYMNSVFLIRMVAVDV